MQQNKAEKVVSQTAVTAHESTSTNTLEGRGAIGLNLSTMLTDRTEPVSLSVTSQENLFASIETRLAQEVLDLTDALQRFGIGTQRIHEELPATAQFSKLITSFFSMVSFQFAYALLKDRDKPLLLDDGAQQLQELGLALNDFIREIDLEGRKFLAVALIDKRLPNGTDRSEATD
ncbi:hypothetical protein SMQC21_13960 [Serratia marcescens]|uniref:hypothetical protein n=1 Tax=Serratia TaxID=613 RepID=UPI0018E420FC|nr:MULTISPECIES: hypothetical protein [Serratia]MBI6154284.1 hypothetical protein [Serratia surfactantfaciens]MDI9108648.1 hypothetical protein [Serratia marcescens]BEO27816.1 hypothetical protein SMQC21_13960 [Serratia marcescens]